MSSERFVVNQMRGEMVSGFLSATYWLCDPGQVSLLVVVCYVCKM